ncbi:unnamed protein product [Blepharisma stoltei]|uniref:Carbonic anhydrase n=1 Tax=Blepharisma stoltei TaxID=1481888 RepID=A0AAU9K3U9_9CILI|nr:unnamed protein product [Blepharisma stoltei]
MVTLISIFLSIPLIVSGTISYCSHGTDWTDICSTGSKQSPINIVTSSATKKEKSEGINFNFTSHKVEGEFTDHNFEIEGNFVDGKLKVGSLKKGYGVQFHFHAPSEHQIDGNSYDLEMHVVQKDSAGNYLFVVGILFKKGSSSNDFIEKVIDSETEETKIDLTDILDDDLANFYYYEGSLTTPPCTESVEWFVWEEIQEISEEQLEFFTSKWAGTSSFGCGNGNNRAVQNLNSRTVTYYESSNLLVLGLSVIAFIF